MSASLQEQRPDAEPISGSTFSSEAISQLITELSHDKEMFFERIGLRYSKPMPYVHAKNGRPVSLLSYLIEMYYQLCTPVHGEARDSVEPKAEFCEALIKALFTRGNIAGTDGGVLLRSLALDTDKFEQPSSVFAFLLSRAGDLGHLQVSAEGGQMLPVLAALMHQHAYPTIPDTKNSGFQRLMQAIKSNKREGCPMPVNMNSTFTVAGEDITPLLYALRQAHPGNLPLVQEILHTLLTRRAQIDLHAKTIVTSTSNLLMALVEEQRKDALGLLCQMFEKQQSFSKTQSQVFETLLRGEGSEHLLAYCLNHMDDSLLADSNEVWLELAARLLVHGAPLPADTHALASRRLALVERIASYITAIDDAALRARMSLRMLHRLQQDPKWSDILYTEGNTQTGVSNAFAKDNTRRLEWNNQSTLMAIVSLRLHLDTQNLQTQEDKGCEQFWRFVQEYLQDRKEAFFTNSTMLSLLDSGEIRNWAQVLDYVKKPQAGEQKADKSNSRSAKIVNRILLDAATRAEQGKPALQQATLSGMLPEPDATPQYPADESQSSSSPRSELSELEEEGSSAVTTDSQDDTYSEDSISPGNNDTDKGKEKEYDVEETPAARSTESMLALSDSNIGFFPSSASVGVPGDLPPCSVNEEEGFCPAPKPSPVSSEPPAVYEDESQLDMSSPSAL